MITAITGILAAVALAPLAYLAYRHGWPRLNRTLVALIVINVILHGGHLLGYW